MAEIGIRELKATLSEVVARAERGEVITVTRHGRPVVSIVPAGLPPAIARLVRHGRADVRGSGRLQTPRGALLRLRGSGASTTEVVREGRR